MTTILNRAHAGTAILVLCAFAGTTVCELPVADSKVKVGDARVAPKATPRSLGRAELFDPALGIETEPVDIERLTAEDEAMAGTGPQRAGVGRALNISSARDGQWTALEDGGWLWTVSIRSVGAAGMRLHVRPWSGSTPGELMAYYAAEPDQVVGPLTSALQTASGAVWSSPVFGEEIRVEYYLPPHVDPAAPESQVLVDGLSVLYRALGGGPSGTPLECHLDVTCFPNWALEAAGVALFYWTDDNYDSFICSGGLLNRLAPADDFTPLFFTATHCEVDPTNVDTLVVVWFYQTPECDGSPPYWRLLPDTAGQTILVQDVASDWTLIGLRSWIDVPSGTAFLGWDPNDWIAQMNCDDPPPFCAATGIHHPAGDFKRISFGQITGASTSQYIATYRTTQRDGSLQPGSSGSPVFDVNHRVRGVATEGSPAFPTCRDDVDGFYGRFDLIWPELLPYLQPFDPIFVNGSWNGPEWGTINWPFNTVIEGVYAVRAGSTVFIAPRSYNEQIYIDKPMILTPTVSGVVTIGRP